MPSFRDQMALAGENLAQLPVLLTSLLVVIIDLIVKAFMLLAYYIECRLPTQTGRKATPTLSLVPTQVQEATTLSSPVAEHFHQIALTQSPSPTPKEETRRLSGSTLDLQEVGGTTG